LLGADAGGDVSVVDLGGVDDDDIPVALDDYVELVADRETAAETLVASLREMAAERATKSVA